MSRLRHLLAGRIASRPYRLLGPVDADHVACLGALHDGDLDAALAVYRGPLLASSESPEIRSWRDHIDVAICDLAVASDQPDALAQLSSMRRDATDVHLAALRALPLADPRRSFVAGSLAASRYC